jgi:Domain of unknown function (DUF4926)
MPRDLLRHTRTKSKIMIKEHERVVLTTSVSTSGLEAGDVGTVVHVYKDGEAYEIEFVTLDGHTAAVLTLEASQVRPVNRRDLTHTRELSVA